MSDLGLPEGFTRVSEGPVELIAPPERLAGLMRLGLHEPEGWQRSLAGTGRAGGRGTTAVVALPDGPRLRIKQMKRGGIAGALWHDRYPGTRRLLDNLRLPLVALERGIPTAAPVALLALEGPTGLRRAWIAFEELEQTASLSERFGSSVPPSTARLEALAGLIRRMHDAGIEHRDLNLGNLLLREQGAEAGAGFVIDLDRARVHDGPLPDDLRRRALQRLERSHLKLFGTAVDLPPWRLLYAAGDPELALTLAQGRTLERIGLWLHKATWSKTK